MDLTEMFTWVWPIIITAIYAVLAIELRRRAAIRLAHPARAERTLADELALHFLGWPLAILIVLGGVALLFGLWPLQISDTRFYHGAARVGLIVAGLAYAREVLQAWSLHSADDALIRHKGVSSTLYVFLYVPGALMVLQSLGVSVMPVVLLLGFILFILAFSMPEVVGNFLSGLYLTIGQPFAPGDVVRIDEGEPIEIRTVGWLATESVGSSGSHVSIPNRQFLRASIERLGRAGEARRAVVPLTLDPESDLDKAKKSAMTVARAVLRSNKALAGSGAPEIYIQTITSMGIEIKVILPVKDFASADPLRDAFLTALAKKYQTDKIQFGYS